MFARNCGYVLLALAISRGGQGVCDAQAFFPLERQVTAATQTTNIQLATQAVAIVGGLPVNNLGAVINNIDTDPNFVTDPENSAATAGNTVATSDGTPTAETIPAETASAAVAESTASIGGIWSLMAGAGLGLARVNNAQSAEAEGDFIILANPSYPTVTTGTLQIEFSFVNASDYENVFIYVSCGYSYLQVMQGEDNYVVTGYLEGYGNVMEMDGGPFPGGVYTASKSAAVDGEVDTYAFVSGDLGDGVAINTPSTSDGGTASISATTSVFVSHP